MQDYNSLKDLFDFVDEYFHPYTCFYTAITDTVCVRTFSALIKPSDSNLYYVFILDKHRFRKYFSAFKTYKAAFYFLINESFKYGLN